MTDGEVNSADCISPSRLEAEELRVTEEVSSS